MAYTAIGLGTSANDGTGDSLRTAGTSINANFVEVYTKLGNGSALCSGISADATVVTLTSPILNTGVSGTAVKDEDDMASNSATHIATQQSIKAYVDSKTSGDTTITSIADAQVLIYDNANTRWENHALSGDITISNTGAATIANNAVTAAKLYNEQVLVIFASAPTTATANVNGTTSSTRNLVVDGNSGTIATGMVVTGSGVSGSPTVVTVTDQNNLVLSHAQSLTNNVALTFTATLKVLRTAGD
tara:strand:- start:5073 stop:5810 length:738 start_codon:yes stop_codon:yes gene_type:complete